MDELMDYAGEVVLGIFILLLRLFGQKSKADKLSTKLKKLKKKADKHGKQLSKDLDEIEKIEKEV